AALTSVPGSSLVFHAGFVTYANAAKTQMLGVSAALIEKSGAVSADVATAMATGARIKAGVSAVVAVTGIAGPDGGTKEKPVGLVYIALSTAKNTEAREFRFQGDRGEIRRQSTLKALSWLFAAAKEL